MEKKKRGRKREEEREKERRRRVGGLEERECVRVTERASE